MTTVKRKSMALTDRIHCDLRSSVAISSEREREGNAQIYRAKFMCRVTGLKTPSILAQQDPVFFTFVAADLFLIFKYGVSETAIPLFGYV